MFYSYFKENVFPISCFFRMFVFLIFYKIEKTKQSTSLKKIKMLILSILQIQYICIQCRFYLFFDYINSIKNEKTKQSTSLKKIKMLIFSILQI